MVKDLPQECEISDRRSKKLTRRGWFVVAMLLISALSFGVATVSILTDDALRYPHPEEIAKAPTEEGEEESEEDLPLENTDPLVPEPVITDPAQYQVKWFKPRYISIPSIGLTNIPVTELDVTEDNQLAAPKSDYVVGWYYRSAIPGEKGTVIMDAHGGDLGTGILKNLPKIKDNDEIIIEMGDGRKFTYKVKEILFKQLGDEANAYMPFIFQSIKDEEDENKEYPTLTLITCTGKWLPRLWTYDQRLFVRAAIVSE